MKAHSCQKKCAGKRKYNVRPTPCPVRFTSAAGTLFPGWSQRRYAAPRSRAPLRSEDLIRTIGLEAGIGMRDGTPRRRDENRALRSAGQEDVRVLRAPASLR
jgi:hypothetical protein